MHPSVVRRLIYFLLVTLLINAGGWTFNREAVADVFFTAEETVSAGAVQPSLQAAHYQGEPLKAMVPCNHWCHAVDHFVGIFSLHPTLLTEATNDYFVFKRSIIPPSLPEGRYRPPRLFS